MTLKDTIPMMESDDFKDRLIAEYLQLDIRLKGLNEMLKNWAAGSLPFTPKCDMSTRKMQASAMEHYRNLLERVMKAEGITCPTIVSDVKPNTTTKTEEPPKPDFDADWSKDTIRNMIRNHAYLDFYKHDSLTGLCINMEDIESETRDWNEMVMFIPKNWLYLIAFVKLEVTDFDTWIKEEYTTSDAMKVFRMALEERQIVGVDFD